MNSVIYTVLNQIRSISILLHPIIPVYEKILYSLGVGKIFNLESLIKFFTKRAN